MCFKLFLFLSPLFSIHGVSGDPGKKWNRIPGILERETGGNPLDFKKNSSRCRTGILISAERMRNRPAPAPGGALFRSGGIVKGKPVDETTELYAASQFRLVRISQT